MNTIECVCFIVLLCTVVFMLYLKRCDRQLEKFEGRRRKYTLKELACALQAIKTFLGKDEPNPSQIHLIEVKDVAFVVDTATIVCVAFNNRTFTTKMYKAVVEKGVVVSMTDNMVQFDETFLEHQKFGGPKGIHDSEQLKNLPFITGDIAKISRYTFSKEIPKWEASEMTTSDKDIQLASIVANPAMRKYITITSDEDIQRQLASIVANPDMRKYITIQSMRGM